jgi:transposase
MAGKSLVMATGDQRAALKAMAGDVADRTNWTLARLAEEITSREGATISRSQLSKVLRKKGGSAGAGRGTR